MSIHSGKCKIKKKINRIAEINEIEKCTIDRIDRASQFLDRISKFFCKLYEGNPTNNPY